MNTDYSVRGLLRFLDLLVEKGLGKANTVMSLKVAVAKVLADLSTEEEADVRRIDVELAVKKLNNRFPNQLAPRTLAEYQRRTTVAVREFVAYLEDPSGYRGIGRDGRNTKPTAAERRPSRREPVAADTTVREAVASPPPAGGTGLSLAFPLRPDFLAQVVVPRDLKTDEAKRLAAFIATLAADYKVD